MPVKVYKLGKIEDIQATSGDEGVMALAVRQDVDGSTVDADGDYAPLLVDSNGRLYVESNWNTTVEVLEPILEALEKINAQLTLITDEENVT